MRNIRKIGIRILVIVTVLFLYQCGVEYFYRAHNETIIFINKEREECNGEIETLICGTSTAQRGIDPEVIDEKMETVSFNTASSLQPLDGTYTMLKDMTRNNPVETVILGIAPDNMMRKNVDTVYKSRLYDRLESPYSKLKYLLEGCSLNEWPYMMFYSARVDNYFDSELIKENVNVKQSEEYKDGQIIESNYKTKGMIANKKKLKGEQIDTLVPGESEFKAEKVKEHNLEYLTKIAEYCNENQIELILVYIPLPGKKIQSYGDMAVVHDYYAKFAEKYDILFWDFNYHKELKILYTNDKFEDTKHLNRDGAEIFSEQLVDIYYRYHTGENIQEDFLDICPYYLDSEAVGE